MDYVLTLHARERMKERSITKALFEDALRNPTKIGYDRDGKILLKKIYTKKKVTRLLLIVGETRGSVFNVITIIETSKVEKYL